MSRDIRASLTATWLKQPDIQEHDQNICRPMIQQQPAGVDNAQTLILLPFEIMRQHLESVMYQQLETATRIYAKQAEELDHAFKTHIDKFETTVKTRLEKVDAVAPANDYLVSLKPKVNGDMLYLKL